MEGNTPTHFSICIYLILDKLTGKQYVGSTYNTRGIWGVGRYMLILGMGLIKI